MAYPGNPELSTQAQERVITAFRQVVTKLQDGRREEALIGLEFVLRLDPSFAPAINLNQQLASGAAEVDLSTIIAQLKAPTTESIDAVVVEALEDFNNRDFATAKAKVEQVLLDLPGHREARQLLGEIQEALKIEAQVGQYLTQARQALQQNDAQEAANFVMMAQALDPHHEDIGATLAEINRSGGAPPEPADSVAPPADIGAVAFDSFDDSAPAFGETPSDEGLFAAEAEAPREQPQPPEPPASFDGPAAPTAPEAAPDFAPSGAPPSSEGGDVSDLFEAGSVSVPLPEPTTGEPTAEQAEQMIKDLLARGEAAAAADDYAAAIDSWSRIFLIDHAHEEAASRVEHLRHAMEERLRRIEPMLDDARAAHFNGDETAAASLVEQVLALDPKHVNATRLKERIAAGQPAEEKPATADSAMPDLEEDLFSDEPVASAAEEGLQKDPQIAARPAEMPTLEPLAAPRSLPWRLIGFATVGLLVVLVGLWAGSRLLSSPEPEDQTMAVNQLLHDADALFEQNKVEEAIHLLEEFPVEEAQKGRIEGRLAKYRQALAPPTPTPIPESLPKAEELLDQGQWMAAYQVVMKGLRRHPTDSGLEGLRQQILQIEPDAASLYNAVASANYTAAVSIAKDLLGLHPGQADVAAVYERCLFNAAMAELRAYNLTAAESYLTALRVRQPDDPEVQRILDFIASYKVRPVDMQLEIFIRSIEER